MSVINVIFKMLYYNNVQKNVFYLKTLNWLMLTDHHFVICIVIYVDVISLLLFVHV